MEIALVLIGFIAVLLYLYCIDKKLTRLGEIALMSEDERRDYVAGINKEVVERVNTIRKKAQDNENTN